MVAAAFVGAIVWNKDNPPAPQKTASPDVEEARVESRLTGYVGSSVCAKCHAGVAAEYHHSPMSRSWRQVEGAPLDGLPESGLLADPNGPYRYRSLIEEARLIQVETLTGDADYARQVPAAYFVGSGNHAQAMVAEENGYLTQLPLAWFPREGEWRLNPGYELKNHRFNRPIRPGCIACHGGLAEQRTPTRNRYKLPIPNGIGCERCHGPGQRHVAHHRNRPGSETPNESDPIVNPLKLSAQLANDVCLQCHLQGDVVVFQPGADALSYRPGEKLSAHRIDFLVQTEEPEAFGVASHGARMMQSRCYLESGKKLTCLHCHDAHQPISAIPEATYDAKCNSCHQPAACQRPQSTREKETGGGCVACHMPKRGTREGRHLVFTDHWIQNPSAAPNREPAALLLGPDSKVTLQQFWPDADPHQARLGSAYVKLHESMGPQRPSLELGVRLLESAVRESPQDRESRFWLASAEIARYRGRIAIGYLEGLLNEKPDWHEARFRLAVAYHQVSQFPQAIAEYERVIRAAPDWMEPYPLAVRLHFSGGNPKAALQLLEQQLTYRQDATAHVNMALAGHLLGEPMEACQNSIDAALKLDPRLTVAHTTRAWLFAQSGKRDLAKESYQRALAIEPENQEAKAGLKALE